MKRALRSKTAPIDNVSKSNVHVAAVRSGLWLMPSLVVVPGTNYATMNASAGHADYESDLPEAGI